MGKNFEPMHIHKPRSLRELMTILKEHPGAALVAGGTDLMRRQAEGAPDGIPAALVSLSEVDELAKIRRRENTVEIGAAVSLERIISLGGNVIPTLLIRVLQRIAGPALRNLATLGGNIALASPSSDTILPLLLLEARCELRRPSSHTWVALSRFIRSPGRPALEPLEVLSAVSVPIPRWNVRAYVKLDPIVQPAFSQLKFAGLAHVSKAAVADFRLIWGGVDPLFLRHREIEALVIGAKTPIAPKLAAHFAERVGDLVEAAPAGFLPEKYHRRSAVRLAVAFLEKVSAYREW
jgi:CO/xanthine dehydrogenase FAD-binding subunit